MNDHQCLGVIGGMGPMATAYFADLLCRMTDAESDQEHLEMIIRSSSHIPDRTRYILDRSAPNPVPEIVAIGQSLVQQGATQIAIPCFTAHCFYDELVEKIDAPIINGPLEVAAYLKRFNVHCAGIMATTGTVSQRLFQDSLEREGIRSVIPSSSRQDDVMNIIYNCVKKGRRVDIGQFTAVANDLRNQGSDAIIFGCTELSLVKRDFSLIRGFGFLDAMEVLAQTAILRCGVKLNSQYENLIL